MPPRPAAEETGVPRDTAYKAAGSLRQVPTKTGKRPRLSPGTSAPTAKKLRETVSLNYSSTARGLLVAVVPSEYPQVQLTR